MAKYDRPKTSPETDDLDDEILRNEVSRIFKEHPGSSISKLEELGFVYHDDEIDVEEEEEVLAKPVNGNQEYLVSYFSGEIPLSDTTVAIFLEERRNSTPNYPLFRKYFKQANTHLLSLILHGLEKFPVLDELLSDLAYFHEFQNVLSTLIDRYSIACKQEENLQTFSELVIDFYYSTAPDGYDALYALEEQYPVGSDKRKVIDFLNEIEDSGCDEEDIAF